MSKHKKSRRLTAESMKELSEIDRNQSKHSKIIDYTSHVIRRKKEGVDKETVFSELVDSHGVDNVYARQLVEKIRWDKTAKSILQARLKLMKMAAKKLRIYNIKIPNLNTRKTTFSGYISSGVTDEMKKNIKKGYTSGGISWSKGNKNYHSEDIGKYSEDQINQIKKYGDVLKGDKKPAGGYKREVTISEKKAKSINCSPCTTKAMSRMRVQLATMKKKKSISDDIVDRFENFLQRQPKIKGVSGVFDPQGMRILDANIPSDAIRLHNQYGSGDKLIGFNSITDTRLKPEADPNVIRKQLRQIESRGGKPALGFDEGSLEAVSIAHGTKDEHILQQLLPHQRSTGILDPSSKKFKIVQNPNYSLTWK